MTLNPSATLTAHLPTVSLSSYMSCTNPTYFSATPDSLVQHSIKCFLQILKDTVKLLTSGLFPQIKPEPELHPQPKLRPPQVLLHGIKKSIMSIKAKSERRRVFIFTNSVCFKVNDRNAPERFHSHEYSTHRCERFEQLMNVSITNRQQTSNLQTLNHFYLLAVFKNERRRSR